MIRDRANSQHRADSDRGRRARPKTRDAWAPLLTAEEEVELAARVQAGDEDARKQLILANLRLVVEIAMRFRNGKVPLDDLIQEGNLGLIRASADFDPSVHGCRFYTYAEVWIKAFIHRSLIANDSLIRIPQQEFLRRRKERRAAEKTSTDGSPATPRASQAPVNDQGDIVSLTEAIVDDRPADLLTPEQERELRLEIALRRLNPVEAWIIRERYGISLTIPEERDWNRRGALASRRNHRRNLDARNNPRKRGEAYYHRSYADLSRDCGLNHRRIKDVEAVAIEKLRAALGPSLGLR